MIDVIVTAREKSHLLLQTINSVIGSTDLELNLIVSIERMPTAYTRNQAFYRRQSRYVFFVNPDVFVHGGTLEAMLELLQNDHDLVTVKSLLSGEEEDGLFGVDTYSMAPSILCFDELYTGRKLATLDFFEQMRWTKHRVAVADREISHAPHKDEGTIDRDYFDTKWRAIRMGETTWLNPPKGY